MSYKSMDREIWREELRKAFNDDLATDSRLLSSEILLRHVDEEALNKCRLRTFKSMNDKIKHLTESTEDYIDMEKARDSKGDYGLDAREFALQDSVEQIYFNYYGHGFNGSPVVDKPGTSYTCPGCGIRMEMSMKVVKPYCPICKHITPIGEMIRDGVMHH